MRQADLSGRDWYGDSLDSIPRAVESLGRVQVVELLPQLARNAAGGMQHFQNTELVARVKALGARSAARMISSEFWYGRYPHTFLERRPPAEAVEDGDVPNVIWSFWTGDNPLSPAREEGLASMRRLNPHTPIEFITPERLDDFIVAGHPLHPAYEFLSLNHRSDYLRAYFLYHFGGGYSDIKTLKQTWLPAFERLREQGDKWALGTSLSDPKWAGNPPGRLGKHVRRYYQTVLSGTSFMCRSRNPLVAEWLREVERVLDYAYPALRESPGQTWGQHSDYPMEWMAVQGNILQPLCLKYQDRLIVDARLAWDEDTPYR